jgi:hypothetical protein
MGIELNACPALSPSVLNLMKQELSLAFLQIWKWKFKEVNKLPYVTHLGNGRAKLWRKGILMDSHILVTCCGIRMRQLQSYTDEPRTLMSSSVIPWQLTGSCESTGDWC